MVDRKRGRDTVQFAGFALSVAERHFQAMQRAYDYQDQANHWADLLTSLDRVFSKISGGLGKDHSFVQRLLRDRKADELLNYLQHARNAVEHGVEGDGSDNTTAELRLMLPDGTCLSLAMSGCPDGKSPRIIQGSFVDAAVEAFTEAGKELPYKDTTLASGTVSVQWGRDKRTGEIKAARGWTTVPNTTFHPLMFVPERMRLVKVLDRNEWYEPPSRHLEKELETVTPTVVASLGLAYYQSALDELRTMVDSLKD